MTKKIFFSDFLLRCNLGVYRRLLSLKSLTQILVKTWFGVALLLILVGNFTGLGFSLALAQSKSHGVSVWGDLSLPQDFSHFPYVNPDAPKGGKIIKGALGSFNSFNPFLIRGNPAAGLSYIYDTLLIPNSDSISESYGLLAKEIAISSDGKSITYTLRPEARFHDGKKITAQDVVWTFDILRTKGSPLYRQYLADVKSVTAKSQEEVVFTIAGYKENKEMPLIIGQIPILPQHFWQNKTFDRLNFDIPLGSGPYKIGDFAQNRFVEYERVDDYWAKDLPTRVGTNNLKHIRYKYFRDATVMFEAFRAGKIDFRIENTAKNWATGYDIPAVRDGRLIKIELPLENGASAQSIIFNLRLPKYQDVRVREALNLAFDFNRMNKQIMFNAYDRLESYFDNSDLTPQGPPDDAQRDLLQQAQQYGEVPARAFAESFRQESATMALRARLAKASQLLDDAGYKVVNQQRKTPEGKPFTIELLLFGNTFMPLINMYGQDLKKLGITITTKLVEPTQYIDLVRGFDFDVVILALAHGLSPGNELRSYWGSEDAGNVGSGNYSGLANGAIDFLVDQVVKAQTRPQLITAVGALDRALTWNFTTILMYDGSSLRLAYWDRFLFPEPSLRFGTATDLWWAKQ